MPHVRKIITVSLNSYTWKGIAILISLPWKISQQLNVLKSRISTCNNIALTNREIIVSSTQIEEYTMVFNSCSFILSFKFINSSGTFLGLPLPQSSSFDRDYRIVTPPKVQRNSYYRVRRSMKIKYRLLSLERRHARLSWLEDSHPNRIHVDPSCVLRIRKPQYFHWCICMTHARIHMHRKLVRI